MAACTHRSQIRYGAPEGEVEGCGECLKSGSRWVHLRMCHVCGSVGCCDSSVNKHASRHAKAEGHPVARSIEPGENWTWCYVDEVAFVVNGS